MELTQFNEISNIISVFFQLVPIYLGFKIWYKNSPFNYIVVLLLFTFFLDIVLFYQYKFSKKDVNWMNNLYILNAIICLTFYYWSATKFHQILNKIFLLSTIITLLILINEFIFKKLFFQFNTNCWLSLQIFVVLNSLLLLTHYLFLKSKIQKESSVFYINLALIIAYSLPVFVNVFQPYFKIHSKILYTSSFVILNFIGLLFSIFIILGILAYKKQFQFQK